MVYLTRRNPKERVDRACGFALDNKVFRYPVLQRLVDRASNQTPTCPPIKPNPLIRDLSE